MRNAPRRDQARVILVLLFLGYLLSFADRVIFSISLKPIKAALQLSDSQLGLLSGTAFALSYALFSPFGGLLADRLSRRRLLAGAIGFWSLATFATGFSMSFAAMALSRAGVGVGEALLHPLAVSLVADTAPPKRRARAFGAYLSAGSAGVIAALLLGGLLLHSLQASGGMALPLLGHLAPWQALFVAAAVPGLVLAAAVLLIMRDPPRGAHDPVGSVEAIGGMAFMRRNARLSLAIFAGISLFQMGAYTLSTWNVVFFERVHGWTGSRTAILLALTAGVGSLVGCLASGRMIDALRSRGWTDAPLRLCLIGGISFAVLALGALFAPSPYLALGLFAGAAFFGYTPSVAAFAALAEVLPATVRARLAGVHTLASGVISNSLGPFLVGLFSDRLFAQPDGIRYALALTLFIAGISGTAIVARGLSPYCRRVATIAIREAKAVA
jgi:MFS family permease